MTAKTKKIVSNIFFYLALAIIYGIAIFAIITKFTGGSLFIGNTRADVVLTDSMSEKNENHLDFLEGTTQIQRFDIVVSQKIDDNTELNVKDCVLFKNPNMGNKTVVHRIINITEQGTSFKINNFIRDKVNNEEVYYYISPTSGSTTLSVIDFTEVKVVGYSYSSTCYLQVMVGSNIVESMVNSTALEGGLYKHEVTYNRTSSAPNKTTILSGTDKREYISSVTYTSKTKGTFSFNASELPQDSSSNFSKLFNSYFLYEIRADKSNTADGIYERSSLISKVNMVIPKIGLFFYFIQSIPGLITLIGLALIITLASFFWTKNEKKKQLMASNGGDVIDNEPPKDEIKIDQEIEKKEPDNNEDV